MAQDRPEIAYAAKELCRRMRAPCVGDMSTLERLVKYVASEPRLVYWYVWQEQGALNVYSDTDVAGCQITRRSTSGGCALLGKHFVKHWASLQKVVTLSSGEAELYGVVKGAIEALGLRSLAQDMGLGDNADICLFADSSAAIWICRRTGIGKVRRQATGQLWIQEKIRHAGLSLSTLFKVLGSDNPADLLTRHVARECADKRVSAMCTTRESGRADTAPQLQRRVSYACPAQDLRDCVFSCASLRLCARADGERRS